MECGRAGVRPLRTTVVTEGSMSRTLIESRVAAGCRRVCVRLSRVVGERRFVKAMVCLRNFHQDRSKVCTNSRAVRAFHACMPLVPESASLSADFLDTALTTSSSLLGTAHNEKDCNHERYIKQMWLIAGGSCHQCLHGGKLSYR